MMISIFKKILVGKNNIDIKTDNKMENVEDEYSRRAEEVIKNIDKEKNERWITKAIYDNDITLLKELINSWEYDLNTPNSVWIYPLQDAIMNERHDMISILFENGADVNKEFNYGVVTTNPLFISISRKDERVFHLLIDLWADINKTIVINSFQVPGNALFKAINTKSYDIFQLVLENWFTFDDTFIRNYIDNLLGSFEWTQDEKDIFYYLYEKAQEKGDINYQEYILGSLYRKVAEKIWSHGNNKKVWEFYLEIYFIR